MKFIYKNIILFQNYYIHYINIFIINLDFDLDLQNQVLLVASARP